MTHRYRQTEIGDFVPLRFCAVAYVFKSEQSSGRLAETQPLKRRMPIKTDGGRMKFILYIQIAVFMKKTLAFFFAVVYNSIIKLALGTNTKY